MKLRSQDNSERKASSIAQKLRAKGRGDLVSKMGLHADKVLARHDSNIEQHMKRKPEESADPADHAEWQKKLDKHNRFYSHWSGVSSGFRKHDPFFDHVGAHGTYKESTDMPKSEQELIAEAVDVLFPESESTQPLIEENYKNRLKKLGFTEQIPAQIQDGLSGVYRFDHPEYEIEARPKADPAKYFKYTIKDKRTGKRRVSQHLTRVEKFLANKDK